jgi:hypothetical protein
MKRAGTCKQVPALLPAGDAGEMSFPPLPPGEGVQGGEAAVYLVFINLIVST